MREAARGEGGREERERERQRRARLGGVAVLILRSTEVSLSKLLR